MIKVSNAKCIRNLAYKSLKASKLRNAVATLAIALTCILFTTLFTVAMSINTAIQQSNFRQIGGYSHGSFKYLTPEQYDELKGDPLIKEYGLHRFLGNPVDECFVKDNIELHYYDDTAAVWAYCDPVEGLLPAEGTSEAAADPVVLELMGIEPVIGARFSMTVRVGNQETVEEFVLSGLLPSDEMAMARMVLIPESRVNETLGRLGYKPPYMDTRYGTGTWELEVMLASSRNIRAELCAILENHGYQNDDPSVGNFVDIGVNWGYTGSQFAANADLETVMLAALVLILIIVTGYLVIYNVFRISVVGDIRFYGLLKTIGATGRQTRRLIRRQALLLSLIGIPVGLVLGWLLGTMLTPAVLSTLDGVPVDIRTANPLIFVGAAVFSLGTVLFSCARPGRMAARVSPVEALRYTEGKTGGKRTRRKGGRVTLFSMAWANAGRSRGKTVVTVLSLSLAVVILTATVFFAGGFDMNAYLKNKSACDFIIASNSYFHHGNYLESIGEDIPAEIQAQSGFGTGGRMYMTLPYEYMTEQEYRSSYWFKQMNAEDQEMSLNALSNWLDAQGRIPSMPQLYGADSFILDHLTVIEGDISKLYEPGGRYMAVIYNVDDYGNINSASVRQTVGDKVSLTYLQNSGAGEEDYTETQAEYEVAALVTIPESLSSRHYGMERYIINAETYLRDAAEDTASMLLLYAFDAAEGQTDAMEAFMAEYTTKGASSCDYESRATYAAEYEEFRGMFLLLGGVLSFIVGLVGVLNFINAILTGILTRKRELAMLQSVGMTGGQMKKMLLWEGLVYALGSAALAVILSAVLEPLLARPLESAFWFFTSNPTLLPAIMAAPVFALLGAAVPLIVYRFAARHTIVERLRETE